MRISLLIPLTLSFGCATMFNSGSQSMRINTSNGEKIKATISTPSGSYNATLPTTITAAPSTFRKVEIIIEESDCYNRTSAIVPTSITPSYWVNLLNGWGFLIDPLTGAMWNYDSQAQVVVSKKQDGKCEKSTNS